MISVNTHEAKTWLSELLLNENSFSFLFSETEKIFVAREILSHLDKGQ